MTLLRHRTFSKRFSKSEQGSSAVEFAIISPIFIALLFVVIETGWLFLRMTMMDHAMVQASRFVYTGAAQAGMIDSIEMRDFICEKMAIVPEATCQDNLVIDLTRIDSFQDIPEERAPCIDDDETMQPVVTFNPGDSNEVVVLRACLLIDVLQPWITWAADMPLDDDNRYRMISSLIFLNEPF